MLSRQTHEVLKRLADDLVSPGTEEFDPIRYGLRSGVVPERLILGSGPAEHLTITGLTNALFRASASALRSEEETEHLQTSDIDAALWDLSCELALRPAQFRDAKSRIARLAEFTKTIARPWNAFEALIVVRNLVLSEIDLEVLGVSFSRWPGRLQPLWQDSLESLHGLADWPGRTIATTVVQAGDAAHAIRRAQVKVDDALDFLRLGIQGSLMVRLDERELLFDRAKTCVVRSLPDGSSLAQTWDANFVPIPITLGADFTGRVSATLAAIDAATRRPDLSTELRERIVRAGRWVGRSTTREDPDDKVLALITALETLLTLQGDRRKGEAIALRSMLLPAALEDGFPDPGPLLYFYEQRSKLVHGSAARVFSSEDYHDLHHRVTTILNHMVELLVRRPDIRRFSQFLEAIETPAALNGCAALLDVESPPALQLRQLALERLAAQTSK